MLLFKGFTSDFVTLQRWQFQLAALNGFVNKLVKAQAQPVHALDWVRIKDNAPPVMGICAVLHQVVKRIFFCEILAAALDNKDGFAPCMRF